MTLSPLGGLAPEGQREARIVTTNIEKLAEQLNALTDYDPMALECTEAVISKEPDERRIYLNSFDESCVFIIDFDQILPYDPAGAPGTTNDVFAGAQISLDVQYGDGNELYPDKAAADKFAKGYLKMVRFGLADAAKEGRISSKILAETKFTPAELAQRDRDNAEAIQRAKESQEEFLNSLDPVTREALLKTGKEIQSKRKSEGKK
jgi:hypothetical protein